MDKCREAFEKSKVFKCFCSTLMVFDETLNCYTTTNSLRVADAEELTAAWWAWQEQQERKIELLEQNVGVGMTETIANHTKRIEW